MDLPIDARHAPYPSQQIDRNTPALNRWHIHGAWPNDAVDITDGHSEIILSLHRLAAERIVNARNAFVDEVLAHLA